MESELINVHSSTFNLIEKKVSLLLSFVCNNNDSTKTTSGGRENVHSQAGPQRDAAFEKST